MSSPTDASPTDSLSPSSSTHHASMESISSASSFPEVDAIEGEVEPIEEDVTDQTNPGVLTKVTLQWNAPVKQEIVLLTSRNRFTEGVELTGDSENGFQATIEAPIGQDLLYRFVVDGEYQTSPDAPVMQLNGEEFNVIHVIDESTASIQAPPLASASVSLTSSLEQPEEADARPRLKKRQSSVHWDSNRAQLMISEAEVSATPPPVASAVASAVATTPSKSTPNGVIGSPIQTGPRFLNLVPAMNLSTPNDKVPSSPLPEEDEGDDAEGGSGDEGDTHDPSGSPLSSASRTKRKNRAHRLKLKQRALFQTPPSSLSNSAPSYGSTPNSGMNAQGRPLQRGFDINQLKMEALQRENSWKEAWIAHEIQTFQQREAERKVLKEQMNEERARWLAKLKEYTSELKTVRDDNLKLKQDLAAAGSVKRLETASKQRTEKFQTLQKNILNEEMLVWIREKGELTQEIEKLKKEKAEDESTKAGFNQTITSLTSEITGLKLSVESKTRDFAALQDELKAVQQQLSQVAGSGNETSQQLSQAQAKLAEEVRAANGLKSELQGLSAKLDAVQGELAAKAKELETAKTSVSTATQAAAAKEQALQAEIKTLQTKLLASQDQLFSKTEECDSIISEKEAIEATLAGQQASHDVVVNTLQNQLQQQTLASAESNGKILQLSSIVQTLRHQMSELNEVTLTHTASFTKQMSETQTFLTQALQVQTNLLHTTMQKYKKEMSERRKLHNLVQELRGNIRVYARCRPISENELKEPGVSVCVTIPPPEVAGEPSTELQLEMAKGKIGEFQFDAVFGPDSTQAGVFSQIVSLVTSVLDGYNVCLFAYGQTGAGKTHTMAGTPEDPGMNLRSLTELFRLRAERAGDFDYQISVEFYEIYNENIFDLLDTDRTKELKIRQASTGVYVEGLVSRPVETQEDVLKLMAEGNKNRSVGKTEMNAHSSRSHSILSVGVHGHSNVTGMSYLGKLHLIDLAGSERISKSQATGDRLKEAQAINLSLSALGNVIEALQKKQSHIPYRNSKLTYILQNSLGGNAKCLMMVNVSPSSINADETNCSLQFASRVRSTELGTASKNTTVAAPSHEKKESSGGESASSSPPAVASATGTPAKRPVSAAVSATKPRVGVTAPSSAVKKVATGTTAPASATKKPLAK